MKHSKDPILALVHTLVSFYDFSFRFPFERNRYKAHWMRQMDDYVGASGKGMVLLRSYILDAMICILHMDNKKEIRSEKVLG